MCALQGSLKSYYRHTRACKSLNSFYCYAESDVYLVTLGGAGLILHADEQALRLRARAILNGTKRLIFSSPQDVNRRFRRLHRRFLGAIFRLLSRPSHGQDHLEPFPSHRKGAPDGGRWRRGFSLPTIASGRTPLTHTTQHDTHVPTTHTFHVPYCLPDTQLHSSRNAI
jgi:hypothetical protein